MSAPLIRGWCPGALTPMPSGDGLIVRIRPPLGRLTASQVLGLCAAAAAHGSGQLEITRRANLQVRGISPAAYPDVIAALSDLKLLDSGPEEERRRNLLVSPLWREGDDTFRVASALLPLLPGLPDLPAKTGFLIDAGPVPLLLAEAGDFRVERGAGGGLILRAEGRAAGCPLPAGGEAAALIRLAGWFAASGGPEARRMRHHAAPLPDWAAEQEPPAPAGVFAPDSPAFGLPFGAVAAGQLAAAVTLSGAGAVRLTPWRQIVFEGGHFLDCPAGFVPPDDRLLRADACIGAPLCPQAQSLTRDLARRLAAFVPDGLHVSGCAKGCARSAPASVVLTGRDGLYDLSLDGRAGDAAIRSGLTAVEVLRHFGAA